MFKKILTKIVNWVLKNVEIDELRVTSLKVGKNTVDILSDRIGLPGLSADPSNLSAGHIWLRSDLPRLRYTPDGSTIKELGHKDEIDSVNNDLQSHKSSKTAHVPSGYYVCATSRDDQMPALSDLVIDSDKDWGGKSITNIGNLQSTRSSDIAWKLMSTPADSTTTTRNSPPLELVASYYDADAGTAVDKAIQLINEMVGTNDYRLRIKDKDSGNVLVEVDKAGNMKVLAKVSVGDLEFRNGWVITEDEKYGLIIKLPNGKKYRFVFEEIIQ